ncbi:MAG: mycofactocin precursor MftA [Acidimicrobiales bacterium]
MENATTTEPASVIESAHADPPDDDLIEEEELLVEEISIDGMCGVY